MQYIQAVGVVAALVFATLALDAQQPPAQGRGGGAGRGAAREPGAAFPQRPQADPAALERGRAVYTTNCAFCHGADARGGDGGPSLLRSPIVLDDQRGEGIAPVVQAGRLDRGMPKFALTTEQISDVAAFIHGFKTGGYDISRERPQTILVGDVKAGETYFKTKCASCHSPAGDLKGFASRFADPRALQQTWLMPGGAGRGAGADPANLRATTVTVTLASGERVEGVLDRIDDFVVSLRAADGSHRAFRRDGDQPRVEVHDPRQPHRALLPEYTDAEIHNVTAYLATLK